MKMWIILGSAWLAVSGQAQAVPFETLLYSYQPADQHQNPSELMVELLSRGIPAGGVISRNVTAAIAETTAPQRARIEALRADLVARLRTATSTTIQTIAVNPVTPVPSPPEVAVPVDLSVHPREFHACAARVLQTMKVQNQTPGNTEILEAVQPERGDGTGRSEEGIYCGKWLGRLGGKVQLPRQQLKLMMAFNRLVPGTGSELWTAFWAARHPQSPLPPEGRALLDVWTWKIAFETVVTGNPSTLDALAGTFTRTNRVVTWMNGSMDALKSTAAIPEWVRLSREFATRLIANGARP